ncbi:DUF4393 domain-containing protein [Alkalihalobacillus sp. 1P02AB]|uniref:DUF4393 domain-containing protein n=1 Tax=Alkalihalobacillus sp. 1P02AB TaxID=3132260 RepID=UPI0039A63574
MTKIKLFSVVPDSTKEEIFNPTSNLIGQAFKGIAHKVLDPLVRYNIVKDEEMKQFAQKIKDKTDKVPLENRDSSKLGLTYKAVEDSTYQLNSEILRDMFSNLIASTVDSRKNSIILPSFSSILKDLSPNDAYLFKNLFRENVVPIVTIRIESNKNGSGVDLVRNVILMMDEHYQDQTSLDTLLRFGLIELNPEKNLVAKQYVERYQLFKESKLYKEAEAYVPHKTDTDLVLDSIRLLEGNLKITSLGKELGSIVITN